MIQGLLMLVVHLPLVCEHMLTNLLHLLTLHHIAKLQRTRSRLELIGEIQTSWWHVSELLLHLVHALMVSQLLRHVGHRRCLTVHVTQVRQGWIDLLTHGERLLLKSHRLALSANLFGNFFLLECLKLLLEP